MKVAVAHILLITVLFQIFNRMGVVMDYSLHRQEYINFCENKSKPALHCNGQCVLMKKLQKRAEKEAREAVVSSEQFVVMEEKISFLFSLPQEDLFLETSTSFKDSLYAYTHCNAIFRPPFFIV
ncbi:hypothetical protein [Sphingobacterium sp. LRF_L2]|uniref:hypothetical protein n=1 Tax=Sphingobacterium sp. LRF_L2 TaxID=3369421 RepID=UPI003F63792A